MNAENTVKLVMNNIIIPRPAKKQKLDKASRDDKVPKKKAMALVIEVIVTDEPA
jgi:hypothetical protein